MPQYNLTIDTDNRPDHEAALQQVVSDYNISIEIPPESELPPETSTPLTVEQYLQLLLDNAVESFKMQHLEKRGDAVAGKFSKADETTRMAVESALDAAVPASADAAAVENK